LKDLIISHGFPLDLLLNTQSTELADIIGIDKDVAKIISDATKRYAKGSAFDITITHNA
jgi:hypothetical protein